MNIYNQKSLAITNSNPTTSALLIFDFATAGPNGTNVSNGIVYLSTIILYTDSANQAGRISIDHAFRRTGGGIALTCSSEFNVISLGGESNFTTNANPFYISVGTQILIDTSYSGGSPATSTFNALVESYLLA